MVILGTRHRVHNATVLRLFVFVIYSHGSKIILIFVQLEKILLSGLLQTAFSFFKRVVGIQPSLTFKNW